MIKKLSTKIGAATLLVAASVQSFAQDADPNKDAVDAAYQSGESLAGSGSAGLIGIAAIGVGVMFVVSMMRKL